MLYSVLMTSTQPTQRLVALDGVRGLAIILVILTHIPLGVLYSLPEFLHPLWTILLANGKTGVSLLFLLSGFLMTWLYPQPNSAVGFWAKRYARVFPPFLVMVVSLAIIRSFKFFLPEATRIEMSLNPLWYPVYALPVILGVAVAGRVIWELGVKVQQSLPPRFNLGKAAFLAFLLAQVGVAAWYVFFLLRVPPAVFYLNWSQTAQMLATTAVNATLTLPFGQYIAQLDGVYWSLITETSFYLLYPIFLVPLVGAILRKRSTVLNIAILIAVLPFLFGLKLVFQRVLGFSIMQIHLAIYFIVGILLALILRKKETWRENLLKRVPAVTHPISILACLAVLLCSVLVYSSIPEFYHPWVQLIWAFPIMAVIYVALLPGAFGKFLESKALIFMGKYSYSLYLTHSVIIEMTTRGHEPATLLEALLVTVASFACSIVLSVILFKLIEQPYFNLKKAKVVPFATDPKEANVIEKKKEKEIFARYSPAVTKRAIVALTVFSIAYIYIGYRSLSAFFTQSIPKSTEPVSWISSAPKYIQITEQPTRFEFTADANNLGTVTTSLKSKEVKGEHGTNASSVPGELEIRLLDENNQLLASTRYKVHEIGESRYHPFGFPVIPDSKGKRYAVEYQIVVPDPARSLEIDASDAEFRTLYLTNKSELLKEPASLATFTLNKVTEPFLKPSSLQVIVLLTPFLLVLWVGLFRGNFEKKMVE